MRRPRPLPHTSVVLRSYRPLLTIPGVWSLLLGGMLARVGGSMFGVAVIVMISSRRGSYTLAGAVSAVSVLVLALAGPVIGRLVDHFGQRRGALPFVVVTGTFGSVTVALSLLDAPDWTLFVAFALTAVTPTLGPMSRARWLHLVGDHPERLHTAMSLEQVLDEAGFVAGPVLAILAGTLLFPEAGLVLAVATYVSGMASFLAHRSTEPPVAPRLGRPGGLAVAAPGVLTVAVTLVMVGVIFGGNEVVAVAVADEAGVTSASSLILGLFAVGSTVSGIVFGTIAFRVSQTTRLLVAAAGMFLLEVPALLVQELWAIAVVMLVAGAATAPMLITALSLAQQLVPRPMVTESMAVAVTGILVGVSVGAAVGGWAVDQLGAHDAYVVPVAAGALGLAVVATRRRPLERAEMARTLAP